MTAAIDQPTHLEPIEYEQLRRVDSDLAEQLGHLAGRVTDTVDATTRRPWAPQAHVTYFGDLLRRLRSTIGDIATFVQDLDLAAVTRITPTPPLTQTSRAAQPIEIDVIARPLPTCAEELATLDQALADIVHIGYSWDQPSRTRRYPDLYIQIGHIVDELIRIAADTDHNNPTTL